MQCGHVYFHIRCLHTRDGTGSHFVTQRPSDPGIPQPGDPVDPVSYNNELQMSTYVWRSILMPRNFLIITGKCKSSVHGLTSSDFSPTKDTWQWLLSFQHFKCTFCILDIFSKTGKTRVSHRVKMMTGDPDVKDDSEWLTDPVTQWPSSVSAAHDFGPKWQPVRLLLSGKRNFTDRSTERRTN